jgi:hypothetical protein
MELLTQLLIPGPNCYVQNYRLCREPAPLSDRLCLEQQTDQQRLRNLQSNRKTHSFYRSIKEIIPRIWEIRACEKRTEVAAKFEIVAAIYHFENIAGGGVFSKLAVENMTDCQNWFVMSRERAKTYGLFCKKGFNPRG